MSVLALLEKTATVYMGSVLLLLSMHLFESELQTGFILKPKPGRDRNHKPKPGLTFAFEARFSPKRQIY